jgi:capsular polysaccharide biosynthesis protein
MGRVVAHIPEAIVRGRRLATIWGNALLPTGYAHSFNWVEEGGFVSIADGGRCAWPATNVVDLGGDDEKFLLGTMAHFGHFFTDCLDRLLAFQQAGFQPFARYLADGEPQSQIYELLAFLDVPSAPSNLMFLNPANDYRVRNRRVASLGSSKPAITASSFRMLRERVMARLPVRHSVGNMLYVGRKLVTQRKVVNQQELEPTLSSMGFTIFYPELHTFEEAVGAFHGADVIVLVIGSSKFNVTFCRPGTKIICIAPEGYVERGGAVATMLRQICSIFSLELCFCSCRIAGKEDLALDSDIVIERNDLQLALQAMSV